MYTENGYWNGSGSATPLIPSVGNSVETGAETLRQLAIDDLPCAWTVPLVHNPETARHCAHNRDREIRIAGDH